MHVPFDSLRPQEMELEIRHGESLAESDPAAALAHFRALSEGHPESGDCSFALGGFFDSSGRPDEAIPRYERALALSPEAAWRPFAYLQLASSYRNVGRLEDAKRLLEEGMEKFPSLKAMPVFLAFVEYDLGNCKTSVRTLLDLILSVAPEAVHPYRRAVAQYKDLL